MDKPVEFSGRPDGRPEAYDIQKGSNTGCDQCYLDGKGRRYVYGEIAILHALDSPYKDGIHHHFCYGHLRHFVPDVVIYDPNDKTSHDLDGNHWREV